MLRFCTRTHCCKSAKALQATTDPLWLSDNRTWTLHVVMWSSSAETSSLCRQAEVKLGCLQGGIIVQSGNWGLGGGAGTGGWKPYAKKWLYLPPLFSFSKAKSVMAKVGYPQFIMNDTYINEDIKTVSVRLAAAFFYILQPCFSLFCYCLKSKLLSCFACIWSSACLVIFRCWNKCASSRV